MKYDYESILVILAVVLFMAYKTYKLFEDEINAILSFIRRNGKKIKKKGKQSSRLAQIISKSFDKKDDEE